MDNIDREIWPGISKARLIQYYYTIPFYIATFKKPYPFFTCEYKTASAHGLYVNDMEGRQETCAGIFTDRRRHL